MKPFCLKSRSITTYSTSAARASERGAREQLIAANFAFDQAIQDLIFNGEKAYYVLAAANASVSAAEDNLTLARTSLDAVQQRHRVGLGTKPQILLAKELEAQAVYDLENAHSMVHCAEARLRQAVGLAADANIQIQNGHLDRVPQDLGPDVETLWPTRSRDGLTLLRKAQSYAPATLPSISPDQSFTQKSN
jgi:outer membrane protein TolC